MTRELLQQALDALEWYAECSVVAGKASDAANAIRAALAAPQGEPVKGAVWHEGSVSLLSVGHEDAYCARRGAQRLYLHPPAAPQGEPFGYVTQYAMKWDWKSEMVLKVTRKAQAEYGFTVPLYAAQPAAPSVPANWDSIALQAAQEIALMWGQDRSQFVSKIHVRVIDAMCAANVPAAPSGKGDK